MSILLDAPNIGELELRKLQKCIDSTYVSTAGPFVPEFEETFASYLGVPYAVAVQSGTAALHIALVELGLRQGDEVIVPALTFVATVNPVLYAGAIPVVVDVDPVTWTLDIGKFEAAITSRTKAVIPVHLYGNPCDMDALQRICERYEIKIIEDATESLGGYWRGKPTGTMGDFGCFSFNGNKLITTGGGGMVVTHDAERARHIKFLVNQARNASKGYFHPEMGFNYRMTNIEASLGLAQMERIDEFLQKKQIFANLYRECIADVSAVKMQKEPLDGKSAWWMPSVTVTNTELSVLQERLMLHGVPTRRIFSPLHTYPYLKQYAQHPCPNAEQIYERGLNLPASTANEETAVRRAAQVLRDELLATGPEK